MKKIKKRVNEPFYKNANSRGKEVNAYYLFSDQVEELDRLSRGNPSRFLRFLLDEILPGGYE